MSQRLLQLVFTRCDSQEEVAKYKARAFSGLLAWEAAIANRYLTKPGRVLDIGCGSGGEAISLSRLGHRVTGVDISQASIDSAKEIAICADQSIEFYLTDGQTLPFADCSFEYSMLWSQVLGNVPSSTGRLNIMKGINRTMTPGGILSLSVHERVNCEKAARQAGRIQDSTGFDLEDGDFLERGDSPSATLCYWHYFRKDELVDLVNEAGFGILEVGLADDLVIPDGTI